MPYRKNSHEVNCRGAEIGQPSSINRATHLMAECEQIIRLRMSSEWQKKETKSATVFAGMLESIETL